MTVAVKTRMELYIANLAKYNAGELVGEWIALPCEDLDERIATLLGDDEEYAIHEYECEFLDIGEYDNPYELNELAATLEELNEHDEPKLKALLEWGCCKDIQEALEELANFRLYDDIHTESDLGHYWLYESGCYDTQSMGNLARYIDHEAFGRDVALDSDGTFTRYGWIERA